MKESYGVFKIINGKLELESKGYNTVTAAKSHIEKQKNGMWTYQKLYFPTDEVK